MPWLKKETMIIHQTSRYRCNECQTMANPLNNLVQSRAKAIGSQQSPLLYSAMKLIAPSHGSSYSNSSIRKVTDEAKKRRKDKKIATWNGRSDEQRLQSEDKKIATLNGRSDEQRLQSEEKKITTLNGRTDEKK